MPTVRVQVFASYAELLGATAIELPLPPGSTAKDLIEHIRSLPGASSLPSAARVAINRAFVPADQLIGTRDEIALIPPAAGG